MPPVSGHDDNVAVCDVLAEVRFEPLARLAFLAMKVPAVGLRLASPDGHVERRWHLPGTWSRCGDNALAALGTHILRSGEPLVSEDLRDHPVAGGHAAVREAGIEACAGVPVTLPDGTTVGSLCAVDVQRRAWSDAELTALRDVASTAEREIGLRLASRESGRSERYFRALVENATEIITVLDRNGVVLYESPSLTTVLGYSPEERLGRRAFDLVHPEDLPHVLDAFREVIESPARTLSIEFRFRHRDGEWTMLSSTGTNALHNPAVRGVAVSSRDVTERRATEDQLRVQKAYFERLFESAPEAIVLLDTEDRVLHVNPEFTAMFGYSADEAVGCPINVLIAPESQRTAARAITDRVAAGESVQVEATRLRKDRSPVEVSILGTPIELGSDRLGVFGIYRDITERKETEARLAAQTEELRALSLTDELTGLANRRGFFTMAEHEVSLARRTGKTLLLLFVDVDDMKDINDAFGHAVGDRALVDAARVLEATFRDSDLVARMGGDEFAVLAWTEPGAGPSALLERLRTSLASHNAREDRPYTLAMSVGTAHCDPASPRPLDDLLRQADADMYEAKRSRQPSTD